MYDLENKVLLLLVVLISLLFGWILWPFFGAILWAVMLAVLFAPLYRLLLRSMPGWNNTAALLTATIIVVMVILPVSVVLTLLLQEAADFLASIQSSGFTLGDGLQRARDALPDWALKLLDRIRAPNIDELRQRLSAMMMEGGRFLAGRALIFGQITINLVIGLFVMLYLLYFLLRDGQMLMRRVADAVPLRTDQQLALFEQFAITIRATVKGSVVVALVQGALGGLMFWFLGIRAPLVWAACMAVLSLLPVVGTGLVWAPVAIYLMMTGATWQGVLLLAYGVLVIGLVDNVLRPILVGKDTRIPDYVVLLSTLGGISVFGVNGFVVGPIIAAMFLAVWHVFSMSRGDDRVA